MNDFALARLLVVFLTQIITPCSGLFTVVDVFDNLISSVESSKRTRSVKVPPMSVAIRNRIQLTE